MKRIISATGKIQNVVCEEITLKDNFIDFAARFADIPGTVALVSGGNLDCARYNILAALPFLSIDIHSNTAKVKALKEELNLDVQPVDAIKFLISEYSTKAETLPGPVAAGLFGYLSYDLKDTIEELPRTSVDDLGLPHLLLFAPTLIVVQDLKENKTSICITQTVNGPTVEETKTAFSSIINAPHPSPETLHFSGGRDGFKSPFTKTEYMENVEKIKNYICKGHVYQVNMSQRFATDFQGSAFGLFAKLFEKNPAPFFSYINAGDHHIVSTSPERFIQRIGDYVEARPIKGTRPRGKSAEEDARLRDELLASKKDDAELSMIVDLLRNDIGKVCRGGSVEVASHKRIEAYQNVYHLVSIVKGVLDRGFDSADLIRATFPGGSITGCPKIRAMEIIDEMEPIRRHIYTGSIGYVSFHDTLDFSIAIRTAIIKDNKMLVSVGGGIVFDSDAQEEFDETLHKGQTLMNIFNDNTSSDMSDKGRPKSNAEEFAWINGMLKPTEEIMIPATGTGFQYGQGFFDTIRAENGSLQLFDSHMERFNKTWNNIFCSTPPDLSWGEIIRQTLVKNALETGIAKVKIIASGRGNSHPPDLIVFADRYHPRPAILQKGGFDLAIADEPRLSPLADHKTLNYLYYYMAGETARKNGADEALILNPNGSISETNSCGIIVIKGNTATLPLSPHVLPSVTVAEAVKCLQAMDYSISKAEFFVKDLEDADMVIIANTLIGAVPALSIDSMGLKTIPGLCEKVNAVLFK